jgi:S-adenosylmethionine uptake transporter
MGEPEERIVFYFSLACFAFGAVSMGVLGASALNWEHGVWLLPMGVLAALGQWCMTRAYRRGSTLVVANLQYSGIVFAALYSLLLFGDELSTLAWLGILVITVSGITTTILRNRHATAVGGYET